MQDLENMVNRIKHLNRASPIFFLSYQRHMRSLKNLITHDNLLDSQFLKGIVPLLYLIHLIWNNTSLNLSHRRLVKAHNTGYLSNLPRHKAYSFLNENRLLEWLKMIYSDFSKVFSLSIILSSLFYIIYHYLF